MRLFRISIPVFILALGLFSSCRTYVYRAICFSAGTEIYDGQVQTNRPIGADILDLDAFPQNSWLRTPDGTYIRGDCVVQPLRIDGKDQKKN
ncbi:MAG: hypothetical protein CMF59_08635 [Leptospiraceae bacterium]|nr:hypothetical protein [Leptospiraceae bacterium]